MNRAYNLSQIETKYYYSFVLLVLFNGLLIGQDIFQTGYFIDDNDEKKECLIKNLDWKNNPNKFNYKLNEQSEPIVASIEDVSEFYIPGKVKFKRFTVDIERTTEDLNRLGNKKNPKSTKETLFLKALVEGKANLYAYNDANVNKFFYSLDDSNPQQLIYINYLDNDNNVLKNNRYRQQLWNNVTCGKTLKTKVDRLEYSEKDFVSHFTSFNQCKGADQINYVNKEKRDWFNMSIRPGIRYSSLTLENMSEDSYADFGNQIDLRFGVEFELVLPYNNNKWAILFEPMIKSYSSTEQTIPLYESIKYQALEIPFGFRHYVFLTSESQIFINASVIYNVTLNSSIKYTGGQEFELKSKPHYAFGLGYRAKNKYSFELRYNSPQDIQREDSSFWTNKNYKGVSAIFGYRLF